MFGENFFESPGDHRKEIHFICMSVDLIDVLQTKSLTHVNDDENCLSLSLSKIPLAILLIVRRAILKKLVQKI